jgi:hypothetical protein
MSLLSFYSIGRSVRCLPFLQWLPRTVVRHLRAVLWRHSDVCYPFRPPPVVPCQPIPRGSPLFCVAQGIRERPWRPGRFWMSRLSRPAVTGLIHARGSQTSQVPESTLCTHAPLSDPGWLVDTTVTECHRVLPSACLHGVGFPQLYNISGFNDAACVLATTVLHGDPRGSRAEFATSLLTGVGWVGIAPTG